MAIRTYFSEKFVEMPNAADNKNRVVQYIGDTSATYTNGYFYKSNGTTWNALEVQSLSEYAKTTDLTTAINNEKTARETGDTTTLSTAQTYAETKANDALTAAKAYADTVSEKAMHFKGSVATYADLEKIENPAQGDMYNVEESGANYAYTGEKWDKLSEILDLSIYALKATKVNGKTLESDVTLKADDVGVTLDVSSQATTDYTGTTKASLSVASSTATTVAGVYTADYTDFLLTKKADADDFASHIANTSNPHNVSAEQVGAYTKDAVNNLITTESTARQTADNNLQNAINGKADKTDVQWTCGSTIGLTKDERYLCSPTLLYSSGEGVRIGDGSVFSRLLADGTDYLTEGLFEANLSVSGEWQNAADSINTSADSWNDAANAISASADDWNNIRNEVISNGADWSNTYFTTRDHSGNWEGAGNSVKASSAKWDEGSNYAMSMWTSAWDIWNSVYQTVNETSGKWEGYEVQINALSGRIEVSKDSIGYYV